MPGRGGQLGGLPAGVIPGYRQRSVGPGADLVTIDIGEGEAVLRVLDSVHIVQEPAEPVAKLVSRVKGQAEVCDFTVKCPEEACDKVVSYSEQLVSRVIVRGLEDSEKVIFSLYSQTKTRKFTLLY